MSSWSDAPTACPHPANLMEWVEQQAVRLPVTPEVLAATQSSVPPVTLQPSTAVASQDSSTIPTSGASLVNAKSRVYDIATLYALGKEALRKNTELKVHTTALKGKQAALPAGVFFYFFFIFF